MSKSVYVMLRIASVVALAIGTSPKAALSAPQIFDPITNQQGFTVQGNKLISNASVQQFVPVGYNLALGYYLTPYAVNGQLTNFYPLTTGLTQLDPRNVPLGQTGSNTVRLWMLETFVPPGGTPPNKDYGFSNIIQDTLNQGLVPIPVEGNTTGHSDFDPSKSGNYPVVNGYSAPTFPTCYYDYTNTCQPISSIPGYNPDKSTDWGLWQAIQSWSSTGPFAGNGNKQVLQANPDIILNIANEWGLPPVSLSANNSNLVGEEYWSDSYIYSINYLRSQGITNTIMVDAQWGQYYQSIVDFGKAIENADPLHNTIFDVHAYDGYNDCTPQPSCKPGWQASLQDAITALSNSGVPVTAWGEFSNKTYQTSYNYSTLVQLTNAKNMGWLYWVWDTPGDSPYNDLAPAMYDLVDNPTYGLKTLATNPIYQLDPQAVPFEFSPEQGLFLGLPTFLGLRYLKRKRNKN
ncbi:MAG: cellulase family glycosylhydrolase [Cyanobacteriota bacterium ELA615]